MDSRFNHRNKAAFSISSGARCRRGLPKPLSTLNWNIVGVATRILTAKGGVKMQRGTSHLLRVAKLLFTLIKQ